MCINPKLYDIPWWGWDKGYGHSWTCTGAHLKKVKVSTLFTESWNLTCKWVMSLSMFNGEVTQLSGMYLKFSGHGSLSTPLTQVIGTVSYPREMSLGKANIFHFKCYRRITEEIRQYEFSYFLFKRLSQQIRHLKINMVDWLGLICIFIYCILHIYIEYDSAPRHHLICDIGNIVSLVCTIHTEWSI